MYAFDAIKTSLWILFQVLMVELDIKRILQTLSRLGLIAYIGLDIN